MDGTRVFFLPNHCNNMLETKAAGIAPMGGPLTTRNRKKDKIRIKVNLIWDREQEFSQIFCKAWQYFFFKFDSSSVKLYATPPHLHQLFLTKLVSGNTMLYEVASSATTVYISRYAHSKGKYKQNNKSPYNRALRYSRSKIWLSKLAKDIKQSVF